MAKDARWSAAFMPLERETESRFEERERLAGIDVEAASRPCSPRHCFHCGSPDTLKTAVELTREIRKPRENKGTRKGAGQSP
jgi:hypothetical protein